MNARKRSNEKSQKNIHSFFLQSKHAVGKPKAAQDSDTQEAEQSQDKRCKGTKRDRDHEYDDDDDEVVCIDATPIAMSKSSPHLSVSAKAAKVSHVDSKPIARPGLAQGSAELEPSPAGEPSAQATQCGSVKALNIPARDPERHQLASRKFAFSRRRFQLGDDQESCKKTAGKLTPLETQVVQLKKQNPGFVMLVECGYKFRLFEKDAEIAATHLNIYSFADHNFMTASIPVHRLHVYVRRLVKKGYKVAVARQMETAALKKAGDNRNKVFERKVTAVYTPATLEAGASEDVGEAEVSGTDAAQVTSSFLLALSEGLPEESSGGLHFVAVEPTMSTVWWGSSEGQPGSSMLESALLYFQPREVLRCGRLSAEVQRTLKAFAETQEGCSVESVEQSNDSHQAAKEGVCDLLSLACQAQDNFTAGLSELPFGVVNAMHSAFTYLGKLGLNIWNEVGLKLVPVSKPGHMTLGSNALHNLHILTGEDAGTLKGSLVYLLDRTKTKSGSRLLRQWLVHPLISSTAICERQDAVQSLLDNVDLVSTIREVLAKCPDVDRAVGRIFLSRSSPSEFLQVMQCLSDLPKSLLGMKDGLESTCDLSEVMPGASIELQTLLQSVCDAEMVQHAREQVSFVNVDAAANNKYTDVLISDDRFPHLFACRKALADAEEVLQSLLPAIAKQAGVHKIAYTSILNQGDFLIELAVDIKPPKDWHKVCSTKKVHRWRPPQVTAAVAEREQASERLQVESKRAWKQMLEDCSPHCKIFRAAAHALAAIDCLQAFAAAASDGECCRPDILDESVGEAEISISNGRCPTLDAVLPQGAVPNDVELRGNQLRAMVISGPNMGGKSSYMCQVGQLVVMAQAGLWVPAQRMRLRPADAIFTRMGAYDNILQGRSTFLEELRDASALLAAATPSSLVIVDELGRGTATHDGVAIAVATLQHLVLNQKCCTLYSTHYPEVCEAAQDLQPHADCFHMSYDTAMWDLQSTPQPESCIAVKDTQMQDAENDAPNTTVDKLPDEKEQAPSDPKQCPQVQRVVFLFKLVRGATGASFGLNVAMMAGLPHSVVAKAALVAKRCKKTAKEENDSPYACEIQGHHASANDVAHCRRDSNLLISENALELLKSVLSLSEASGAEQYVSLQDRVRQMGSLLNA